MSAYPPHPSQDPRLSAYLFNEMEPLERQQFEEELARNERLRTALTELRAVSNLLGRTFAEEPLPHTGSQLQKPPADSPVKRKLSPRARAGKISRLRQEVPKIQTSYRNRYTALAGSVAAAFVLAGLVTLQSIIQSSTPENGAETFVPLTTTRPGEYTVSIPLAEEIAQTIEKEATIEAENLENVSLAVATGLAEALDLNDRALAGQTSAARAQTRANPLDVPKPEITLGSAFARPFEVEKSSPENSPTVFLETNEPIAASIDFQPAQGFLSSRIPLYVNSQNVGALRRELERNRNMDLSGLSLPGLLNAFDYASLREIPEATQSPFKIDLEIAESPWNRVHYLVRLTLQSEDQSDPAESAATPAPYLAENVRLKVRFNPEQVAAYRLIGYEPEVVTSAEILAQPGESVRPGYELTVLYEIIPVGSPIPHTVREGEEQFEVSHLRTTGVARGTELLWADVDFTLATTDKPLSLTQALKMPLEVPSWHGASRAFRWAAAVASFGMEVLEDPLLTGANWELIEALARSAADEGSGEDYFHFISMIESARAME